LKNSARYLAFIAIKSNDFEEFMVTSGLNSYIKYENWQASPILLLEAVRTFHFLSELSFQGP